MKVMPTLYVGLTNQRLPHHPAQGRGGRSITVLLSLLIHNECTPYVVLASFARLLIPLLVPRICQLALSSQIPNQRKTCDDCTA